MKSLWMAGALAASVALAATPAFAQGRLDGPGRGGAVGLRFLRAADANGDRSVERAEFDALAAEEFAWRDRNGDGALDGEDLSPAVRRLAAARAADGDEPRRRRARADENEDGRVTQAEFMSTEARQFERLDSDENGVITPAELDEHVETRRNRGRWWRAP